MGIVSSRNGWHSGEIIADEPFVEHRELRVPDITPLSQIEEPPTRPAPISKNADSKSKPHARPKPKSKKRDAPKPKPSGSGDVHFSTARQRREQLGQVKSAWRGRIPKSHLTLLVGEAGLGKTSVTLGIVKIMLTPGMKWPDNTPAPKSGGKVLWWDTESGEAITVDHIFDWGLPADRIVVPDAGSELNLSKVESQRHFEALITTVKPVMVVIDSFAGCYSGNENSAEDTQLVLKFLAGCASKYKIALVIVHHLRKRATNDMRRGEEIELDRIRGSNMIVYQARSVIGLDKVDDDLRLRVLKSNLYAKPEPLGVTIGKHGVVFSAAPKTLPQKKKQERQEKAENFLRKQLASGPKSYSKELLPNAATLGLIHRDLYGAKERLKIPTLKNKKWAIAK